MKLERSFLLTLQGSILLLASHLALAEVYFYQGPNGERLVTDRPPPTKAPYRLIVRRDTMTNAGHIMANRPIKMGGSKRFGEFIRSASVRFNVDPALVEVA